MERYGVVRRLLKEVAESSWGSVISKRVNENDPVDGLSQQVIEELIAVEEEAKGKLDKANQLLEAYLEEDRLPSRYDMLEESHGLFSRVLESDAAFDAALVTNQMHRIERDLKDLEQRLPIEPETVHLSSGCFEMGGRQNDEDVADDEALHRVCVDDFEIGIYEVTFHEYDRFVKSVGVDAPEDMGWGREYRPIINVSYLDIAAYIEWLSYQTDKLFRLPTEAEWEYAARAGKEEIYPWGDKKGTARANCMNCNSDWNGRKTAPVGSFEPNNWGLYDVSGNAAEKTCSTYQSSYQGEAKACTPLESSGSRVVRGGSWKSHSRNIRLSYRDTIDEIDHRSRFHGFRLVRDN
jgi:formylglycine-generating enzyme required for sulfatase activity